jgi:hypothetical protein
MKLPEQWNGENPFYLLHVRNEVLDFGDGGKQEIFAHTIIDLDTPGWMAEAGRIFRSVGELHLVRKVNNAVALSVHLNEGEQGYYVARHVGFASTQAQSETIAYGIGKKRANGNEDNLWALAWGQVCGGNDVEYFAMNGLKQGLPSV